MIEIESHLDEIHNFIQQQKHRLYDQIVEINDDLVEHYKPQRRARARRNAESTHAQEDKEFARELREIFRDTRATYKAATKLMNSEDTTKLKKMVVQQHPLIMAHGVNSEQVAQLLKSSEELARLGTRLPLWGAPTPDVTPPTATGTGEFLRELRELLRDTRAKFGITRLMNHEDTTKKRKMLVMPDSLMRDHAVNSEQVAEILKSSEERNRGGGTKFPLIGMPTPDQTLTTHVTRAIDFIRELREIFRDTRTTPQATTEIINQAEYTSKKRIMKPNLDPLLAAHQVASHQVAEIIKDSDERGSTSFPLIGV
ncbi:hypothetical protein M8J77_002741 [Diaphorina citri]|nr:hypothetical protein M8J77_002741 [Diaphorina citri]